VRLLNVQNAVDLAHLERNLEYTLQPCCQLVYFQSKNPNSGQFQASWNGKCWYILWRFGILSPVLVYF
jgi:hypothetical protein